MIQHVTHIYSDLKTLATELSSETITRAAKNAQGQLVQIYCAEANQTDIESLTSLIASKLPGAVVVGATTVGEIGHGRLLTSQTVIGFTFFALSHVHLITIPCNRGDEQEVGAELGQRIHRMATNIAGVLLLSTPLSLNASALLHGLESTLKGCLIFGGGAGDYAEMNRSLVFTDSVLFDKGAIAVVFSGSDLHIESKTSLGWRPLGQPMRVTKVDGLSVQHINDQPAFNVYQRYLSIANNDQFYLNALEFPFLLERNGELLARVPVATDKNGGLQFVADIREGETVRLGYGDMDRIFENSRDIHHSMARFSPQVVFLYTCGCRRFLMQGDVEVETLPFENLAPTFGFYTYGEFFGSTHLSLLNSTMVAVSLREGPASLSEPVESTISHKDPPQSRDPYSNKHTRVVSRLLRFIDAVTSELEASNREATKLSITDRLTQLVNRVRLEQVLDQWLHLAQRYDTPFSVIMLDMDHFKRVNDTYGHLIGDDVLVHVAKILTAHARSVDVVGRWGGEEFLIIAPNTNINEARQLAENLRLAIENTEIPVVGYLTGSFGVAGYHHGDDPKTLIARADTALYTAKRAGRNRVEVSQ